MRLVPSVFPFRKTTRPHGKPAIVRVLLLLFLAHSLHAQKASSLEARSKDLRRQIQATSKMLRKTRYEKNMASKRLLALDIQITTRQKLLDNLHSQIDSVSAQIRQNEEIISILTHDLQQIRDEYAHFMRQALREKLTRTPWLFVLAARDLNQAYQRWVYLKQYNRRRKNQLQAIAATNRMLRQKLRLLDRQRTQYQLLLQATEAQSRQLTREKINKTKLLRNFKRNEQKLKQKIARWQREQKQLNRQIAELIQSQERKAGPARPPASAGPLPTDFRRARGKLIWPAEGFITGFFGRHPHPSAPKVIIINNGVDIRIRDNAQVKAVFKGTVAAVSSIPGLHYTVLIKHGPYYTAYANLETVSVSSGQQVGTGDVIGTAAYDPTLQYTRLHFEIWKGKQHLNPVHWLRK